MEQEHKLWCDSPPSKWTEALPVGNGRLGAMVFGGTKQERIQLNEDSLWSGGQLQRNNPDCFDNLENIRTLLRKGDIKEAERQALYSMTGTPDGQRTYQTMGDLFLTFHNLEEDVSRYHHELDLSTALCCTEYQTATTHIQRTVFASYPDNVLVIYLKAVKGTLDFHAKASRRRHVITSGTENGHTLAYTGGPESLSFCCMLRAQATGGSVKTKGEYVIIEGATEAVLYLTAATTFRASSPKDDCRARLNVVVEKGYEEILRDHLADYQPLYEASSLFLENDSRFQSLPTAQRLEHFREHRDDTGLLALYYHYGRYLLIACSRPGSLPANLQGIWCEDMSPSWDSKYTININTEMNYWPAELCGLSSCHLPLFDHLKRMYPNGKETAKAMYRAEGWVAHHNTDIWGDTAPQDSSISSTFWVMGGAWLSLHLWEHYEYTLDLVFLENHYFLLEEACRFLLTYSILDGKGQRIISPTISPENTYQLPNGQSGRLCAGSAMDSQIMTHLFQSTLQAAKLLNRSPDFQGELASAIDSIPPITISESGRILEWTEDYKELEPGHRHISHLYALFPGDGISAEYTPALAAAAKETLVQRLSHGGGHTGWSRAWIINFWAALGEADKTKENIEELLARSTYPNLFDSHPPFQIDGNFGGTAGIAHAILQSKAKSLHLLPALPDNWKSGSLKGVRAKGNLILDISWKDNLLTEITVQAGHSPYEGTVFYNGKQLPLVIASREKVVLSSSSF